MQFSTTEAAVVGFRIFDVSVLIPAVYIAMTRFLPDSGIQVKLLVIWQ